MPLYCDVSNLSLMRMGFIPTRLMATNMDRDKPCPYENHYRSRQFQLSSFSQDHLTDLQEILCPQSVEVDASGYLLAVIISAVPVCRFASRCVDSRALAPKFQCAYQASGRIVYRYSHVRLLRQLIWKPRLRVKRVGIIGQKARLYRYRTLV